MEFGISAVTANRSFSKCLSRCWTTVESLEQLLNVLPLSSDTHRLVILTFVDQCESADRVIFNKDGVCQLEVSIDSTIAYSPKNDEAGLRAIAKQMRHALANGPFDTDDTQLVLNAFDSWADEHV